MARVWRKNINVEILSEEDDGKGGKRKRHWLEDKPESTAKVHPQWRQNVSDNMLMNLFADKTFAEYYTSPIEEILKHFYDNMETIPWYPKDEDPFEEREKLSEPRIRRGRVAMSNAIDQASKITAAEIAAGANMSMLYTTAYDKLAKDSVTRAKINKILDALESFDRAIRWICIPFLHLESDLNPNGKGRPTPSELRIHIEGDNATMLGLGRFNFEDFLFYKPEDDNGSGEQDPAKRWQMYKDARNYAIEQGFLDEHTVVGRAVLRISADIAELTGFELKLVQQAMEKQFGDVVILGGGNGYKCKLDPVTGFKVGCEPGAPAQYCVNNGSQYC